MRRYCVALILEFTLLAVSIRTGESIKCYTCNSQANKNCGDPITKEGLDETECTATAVEEGVAKAKQASQNIGNFLGFDRLPSVPDMKFACQKIDVSDNNGNTVTIRGCTIAKTESVDPCAMTDVVKKVTSEQGKVDFCETCEEDQCNGTNRQSSITGLLLVVPSIVLAMSRWVDV
ncbi:UPAR/Ly6 domain-containing protein CG9338-like [Periplaneta americana]|uniref:UPAR/Ly6 domain-containing protein CG9338-like n=1 Tax=Periplaneta americana TaxID=6978 RepID=UPI0037E85861